MSSIEMCGIPNCKECRKPNNNGIKSIDFENNRCIPIEDAVKIRKDRHPTLDFGLDDE